MLTYIELITRLKDIKEMGYIKTHRGGATGVGKTLEDILEITENNIAGPNSTMAELKSARKNSTSMLTLFTKSPLPKRANANLLERFGYEGKGGRKRLETTVNALSFNQLKGKLGFKVEIQDEFVNLITPDSEILAYWDKNTLKSSFERKLPKLIYVKADVRGQGGDEEFWYNEAWLLSGFSFDHFAQLLKEGVILVDIRIGQYPDGRTHDHGTGFRVLPDKLDLCFSYRERII